MRRIVRKSLEPEYDDTETQENDSNKTENIEPSDNAINQEKPLDSEDVVFNKMIEDALYEIHNFVPKRIRKEQPMFHDLSFENEKRLRVKNRGAPYYWHMPFRHDSFLKGMATEKTKDNISDREETKCSDTENMELHNSRYCQK